MENCLKNPNCQSTPSYPCKKKKVYYMQGMQIFTYVHIYIHKQSLIMKLKFYLDLYNCYFSNFLIRRRNESLCFMTTFEFTESNKKT